MGGRVGIPCLALLLAVAVACSRGPTVLQRAGTATPDDARAGAPAAATGAGATARGAGQPGGRAPVDTVEVDVLEPLFPMVTGWERGEVQGEKSDPPVSVTLLQLEYHKGDARIDASLVDSGFNQSYLEPFLLFVTQGYKKETQASYERAVKVGDYPAWERWDSTTKSGELNVLVAGRFVVQLDGVDIENPAVLGEMLQKFDLKKLEQVR